jgi:hypothetical protein
MQSDDELIVGFGKRLVKYYKEGVSFFNKQIINKDLH